MLRFFGRGEGEPDSLAPLSPAWERGWGRGVELKLTRMTDVRPASGCYWRGTAKIVG